MRRVSRGFGRGKFIAGIAILAVVIAVVVWLRGSESPTHASTPPPKSSAARLLDEIVQFRTAVGTLESDQAVKQWFSLYDRAAGLPDNQTLRDMEAFDPAVGRMVGEHSLLAALPPPTAWAAFRAEATRRALPQKASTQTLGLRYLSEILVGDRDAAVLTLASLEKEKGAEGVREARMLLARLYGDAAAQVSAFENDLGLEGDVYDLLAVPDLLALAGEPRATALLTRAVKSKRILRVTASEPTRQLARRVALANVSQMGKPQWGLAASVDGTDLYEAMSKRFKAPADDDGYNPANWQWRESTTYYFLGLVREGRQRDAERVLEQLGDSGENVQIPREAVEALQRAQLNEPLYRFLDGLLQRRPEIRAWPLYLEQAAFTGHSKVALSRIDDILARKGLAPALRAELQASRFDALLASDQVESARTAASELLASPPKASEQGLHARVSSATRALRAGRLLGDETLTQTGLKFLLAALELYENEDPESSQDVRDTLFAELRRLGRPDEAMALARRAAEKKPTSFGEAFARRLGRDSDGSQVVVVEIAGIHSAAGRHDAVLELMKTSPRWGAEDLAELVATLDSQGEPMGAIAARALAATGDKAAALRAARATVAALPGKDAGYELVATLDPDAIKVFDAIFSDDEFEERPLIWKASLQLAQGAIDAAEATIRQAIAIDPSDGEEGPNDRMRAYAVLSEILRRQGDGSDARLYASAVEAIRISELGDQFYSAGLYDRAFVTYREALDKFSDAYCIQSRLAVQLNKQGRRKEALVHYRRAYELMPASFGRVESHCFGCESVFEGAESQSLAERVFTDIIRKSPDKPQAYYLLAYLRDHQGRYAEALQPLRSAVSLDPHYLNAWKRLDEVATNTYVESAERDIARLKIMELDPLQRHAHYNVAEVGDLRGLWTAADRARALHVKLAPPTEGVFPLEASARLRAEANSGAGESMPDWSALMPQYGAARGAAATLYEHGLVSNAATLMGLARAGEIY